MGVGIPSMLSQTLFDILDWVDAEGDFIHNLGFGLSIGMSTGMILKH